MEVCRICLFEIGPIDSVSIATKVFDETVLQLISACASIKIFEEDFLPKFICKVCFMKLKDFHEFQNKIIKSDLMLKEKLSHSSLGHSTVLNNVIHEEKIKIEIFEESEGFVEGYNNKIEVPPENVDTENKITKEEYSVDCANEFDEIFEEKEDDNFKEISENSKSFDTDQNIVKTELNTDFRLDSLMSVCKESTERQKTKQTKKIHECKECNKTYTNTGHYNVHMTKHTGEKRFVCEFCPKRFARSHSLVHHRRVHTGEKPYKCDVCFKSFTAPSTYYVHRKIHNGDRKFKCTMCDESFIQSKDLTIHVSRIHTGERPYMCELCSSTYRCVSTLTTHQQVVHGPKEMCPICHKMISPRKLKQHIRGHNEKNEGIKRFACDQCDKTFTCSSSRKKHLLIHSGQKPFSCEICKKCFNQRSSLKTHMKVHSDATPFQCDYCAKSFKYKHQYKSHLETHQKQTVEEEKLKNK